MSMSGRICCDSLGPHFQYNQPCQPLTQPCPLPRSAPRSSSGVIINLAARARSFSFLPFFYFQVLSSQVQFRLILFAVPSTSIWKTDLNRLLQQVSPSLECYLHLLYGPVLPARNSTPSRAPCLFALIPYRTFPVPSRSTRYLGTCMVCTDHHAQQAEPPHPTFTSTPPTFAF